MRPPRPARCRWRVAGLVGVHAEPGRAGHFSGLERCASVWACPVCSAVIRHLRALEIQEAADRWGEAGNSTLMLTFTLRHRRQDGLRESLDLLQAAYRRVTGSQAWRGLMKRHGYVGQIRALEMPWGSLNGWHPHAHALAFLTRTLDDDELARLEVDAFRLWEAAVIAEGGRSLLASRGLKVTRGAAAYVAKVQEREWLAGAELARFDLKRGRQASLMPFELLDRQGEAYRALWCEYVEVTRGRRAIFWSKGLRTLVGLGQEELTDEEVIAQTETADLVFVVDGEEYDEMRDSPEHLVGLLETAEGIAESSTTAREFACVTSATLPDTRSRTAAGSAALKGQSGSTSTAPAAGLVPSPRGSSSKRCSTPSPV